MDNHDSPVDPPLQRLLRWEEFGGHWRVAERSPSHLQIALLTCDGGATADCIETGDAAVLAYVGTRLTDQDDDEAAEASGRES